LAKTSVSSCENVFFIRELGFITPIEARRITFEDALRFEQIRKETYRSLGFELISIESADLLHLIKAALYATGVRSS